MKPPAHGLSLDAEGVKRCFWSAPGGRGGGGDDLYQRYHDGEWGLPVADDTRLFEKICLEGFQSGLSWLTILRKRENFRAAFRGFEIPRVARFTARDVNRLLKDSGIVRHRGKIESTINNARRALELIDGCGSLAAYVWQFEPDPDDRPKTLDWKTLKAMSTSPASTAMSKDLKKRGWSFVGPTTIYAFMQAVGLVNDHLHGCHVRERAEAARQRFRRPRFRHPR